MTGLEQYYGPAGTPLHIEGDPAQPAQAWVSHRARLRGWLDTLPDPAWAAPTRCPLWDTTGLVRHLASTSQFLGFTLHEAARGNATTLLRNFDTHRTVEDAAASLGDLDPAAARRLVREMDAAVAVELDAIVGDGWMATAEAPPGHVPAHVALSHILFDSWVHEYDLMLPHGEHPIIDPLETEMVARYLFGLAAVATNLDVMLDVRLTEPDLRIGVEGLGHEVRVTVGSAPAGAPVVEGRASDVIDRTTGRPTTGVVGDEAALVALDRFAALLV